MTRPRKQHSDTPRAAVDAPANTASPRIPEKIGPYRIHAQIAVGAMGVVYAASSHEDSDTCVAVKVLRAGLNSAELRRRFERERQITTLLHGKSVPTVRGSGETADGLPYFALDLIDGLPIDAFCEPVASARIQIADLIRLFREVCLAVQAVHERGVVHGDLKPHNILVDPSGAPWLLDFGTARVVAPPALAERFALPSDTGSQICTPQFASPEQLAGWPPTFASDVYSLGALLYALLTGRPPFERGGRSMDQLARYVRETRPQSPGPLLLSRWPACDPRIVGILETTANRALATDPAMRFAPVSSLVYAITHEK